MAPGIRWPKTDPLPGTPPNGYRPLDFQCVAILSGASAFSARVVRPSVSQTTSMRIGSRPKVTAPCAIRLDGSNENAAGRPFTLICRTPLRPGLMQTTSSAVGGPCSSSVSTPCRSSHVSEIRLPPQT